MPSSFSSPTLIHITTVPMSLKFFQGHIGYLKERGFDVQAITSPGESANEFAIQQRIAVHTVPMEREPAPYKDCVALLRLWWALRRLGPQVVHSHTPKAGLLGTLAARMAGVKVVFFSVFGLVQMTATGFRKHLLDFTTYLSCALADRVWCDSFSMRDYMIRASLCPAAKIVVFGQGSVGGVDAQGVFAPQKYDQAMRETLKEQLAIPKRSRVLGFVGRIVKDKGMHELAGAWRALRQEFPDVHLLLVGPIEVRDPLQADDLEMFQADPRIHCIGQRQDVAPYYAIMDVFVMPSYREGFGLTNIEAAAMELPVVSTRIPGCVDSVDDGVTGTLVAPRNQRELTMAIRNYLSDAELRRKHGKAGRQRVLRDFCPETIWEAANQEYVLLLQAKGLPLPKA